MGETTNHEQANNESCSIFHLIHFLSKLYYILKVKIGIKKLRFSHKRLSFFSGYNGEILKIEKS